MSKKCDCCGKEQFTIVKGTGSRRGLSSSVCIDCLEELIKMNKVYWCIYHNRYEYYEKDSPIHKTKINNRSGWICDSAAKGNMFHKCKECGDLTYKKDLYQGFCKKCASQYEIESRVVCSYHNSHSLPNKFHGNPSNGIYFGLEIESEYKNFDHPSIVDMTSLETRRICYFERDGSLDDGFETITHPLSYEFMRNNHIVEKITSDLKQYMVATSNCGLHIHVSKTDEVAKKLPQIIMFLENNKEDVINFCGRKSEYANFYTYENKKINSHIANEIIFNSDSFGRRRMINLTNKDTIEFRGFAGTLEAKKIYKYINFIITLLETNIDENTTFNDLSIPDLL